MRVPVALTHRNLGCTASEITSDCSWTISGWDWIGAVVVHAAVKQAAQALNSWRLEQCVLYVTLEPCPMCAGAIVLARLPMLVYGANDPKAGACDTLYQITSDPRLNHRAQIVRGVLATECGAVLSEFFANTRRRPV